MTPPVWLRHPPDVLVPLHACDGDVASFPDGASTPTVEVSDIMMPCSVKFGEPRNRYVPFGVGRGLFMALSATAIAPPEMIPRKFLHWFPDASGSASYTTSLTRMTLPRAYNVRNPRSVSLTKSGLDVEAYATPREAAL